MAGVTCDSSHTDECQNTKHKESVMNFGTCITYDRHQVVNGFLHGSSTVRVHGPLRGNVVLSGHFEDPTCLCF